MTVGVTTPGRVVCGAEEEGGGGVALMNAMTTSYISEYPRDPSGGSCHNPGEKNISSKNRSSINNQSLPVNICIQISCYSWEVRYCSLCIKYTI